MAGDAVGVGKPEDTALRLRVVTVPVDRSLDGRQYAAEIKLDIERREYKIGAIVSRLYRATLLVYVRRPKSIESSNGWVNGVVMSEMQNKRAQRDPIYPTSRLTLYQHMRRGTGRRIDYICVKMDRPKLEAHGEISEDTLRQHPPLQRLMQRTAACMRLTRSRAGVAALTAQSCR